MPKFPTRRTARITAAALAGMVVATLALPGAAGAVTRDYRDNGEIAYTESSGSGRESYLVWPDGTHGRKADDVNVFGRGIVGGWSADGETLFVTDPDIWTQHRLVQPWSTSGHAWSNDAYDDDVHSIGRLGQGAFGESGSMFWGSTAGLRRQQGPSPTEFLTTKEALDPSFANTDRLVWVSPTQGVMLLDDASDVPAPATPAVLVPGSDFQHASISRDGTRVAYSEHDGTSWNVRVVAADGSVPPANLETGSDGSDETLATMSPDGGKVAFVSDRSGKPAIWIAPVDGSTPATMVPNTERAGAATIEGLSWQPGLRPEHNPTTLVAPDGLQVGKVIRPNYGGQPEGTPGTDVAYEWHRCSIRRSDKDTCYPTGGTGLEYTMVEADRGFRIKLTRTTTNAVGMKSSSVITDWRLDPPGGAPGIPTLTSPIGTVGGSTAKVEWTGAEPGGWFECSTDWGVTWKECASGMELTGLKHGYNSFYLAQRNDYGSWGTYLYGSITTDQQKPYQPQIWSYPSPWDETMDGTFQWSGEGTPENTFECQEDDGAWTPCTSPRTMSVTTTGQHTFRVRETDGVGLVSDVATRTWTARQPTPPAVPAAAPTRVSGPAALVNTKTATIAFTGADPAGTGFECRVDAGPWAACASPFTTAALSDGPHTAEVRQLNAAGPGAVLTTTWTVDTTKPVMPGVTAKPAASTPETTATIEFTLEDGATAECQVDAGPWSPCASPLALSGLAQGTRRVYIRQTDGAGNVSANRFVSWTVLAPPAGVVSTPTVEAPAAEAPAPAAGGTAVPATTAPGATPAPAPKPKLKAVLGDRSAGNGSGAGAATPTITVDGDGVAVGCSAGSAALASCRVSLYASRATGATARAARADQVLVGRGTYRRVGGGEKATVDVELNATGRALLRRSPGGLRVSVAITGRPVAGGTLEATGVATLLAGRVRATVGGFAVNRAELTAAAQRQLRTLARQVGATARAVHVVGHTDGSTTDSAYLKRLGALRARAVAAFLREHGVDAKATLVSRGATAPQATNATKAGRALNRRVELRIER